MIIVPFMLMPVISGVITYFSIYLGITPMFTAVEVAWTMPPIIYGFIIGGWKNSSITRRNLSMIILCIFTIYSSY